MKNKRVIGIIAGVAVLGAIGGTIAYYNDAMHFDNKFKVADYVVDYTEVFDSPDDWTPCTTTPKTLTVTNRGNSDVGVRISMEKEWKSLAGTNLPITYTNAQDQAVEIAHVTLANTSKWINGNDGYYYYYKALGPNETTESFMESVTLDCDMEYMDLDNVTYTTTATGIVGESNGTDYVNAKYHLKLNVSTIQRDAQQSQWGRL